MTKRRNAINVHVGRMLRNARHHKGWTQEHAAKRVKMLRTSIVIMEQGNQNINVAQLVTLCKAYGVRAYEMFDGVI